MVGPDQRRQNGRRLLTTRMVLRLGFGVLLTLLILSGLNAIYVISQVQSRNEDILSGFLARETKLDELQSEIYLSGTYVRDYLLEPDPAKAESSRQALSDTKLHIQSMLPLISSVSGTAGLEMYDALQREIREYWQTLDPVLAWSAERRRRDGFRFLHDEVLPRRSSTLSIADTIRSLNQRQLMDRDHQIFEMFSGLRNRLIAFVLAMFLCGLALAFAATFHILRLEEKTMEHLKEVSNAKQELKSLSTRLVETQENERKNISRDLHDAVGQSMSAVQFELHDLSLALADYPESLRSRVDGIRKSVELSVSMVRNMALLLRPSILDDVGLAAALEWHANQVSKSIGIRIRMIGGDLPEEVPEEHKICVFRVVQEALNNVCRHAHASSVEIAMSAEDGDLLVIIRDDGKGFSTPRHGGLGLVGMHERVENLGGRLQIDSQPGKGAEIGIRLPLPQRRTVGNSITASVT